MSSGPDFERLNEIATEATRKLWQDGTVVGISLTAPTPSHLRRVVRAAMEDAYGLGVVSVRKQANSASGGQDGGDGAKTDG